MVYIHLLSSRHCGYMSEHSEDLPSWSPKDELANTSQPHRPWIRHLSTIYGSSLFLLCILTVPPADSYCDPSPTPNPCSPTSPAHPKHWPWAGTSTRRSPLTGTRVWSSFPLHLPTLGSITFLEDKSDYNFTPALTFSRLLTTTPMPEWGIQIPLHCSPDLFF